MTKKEMEKHVKDLHEWLKERDLYMASCADRIVLLHEGSGGTVSDIEGIGRYDIFNETLIYKGVW